MGWVGRDLSGASRPSPRFVLSFHGSSHLPSPSENRQRVSIGNWLSPEPLYEKYFIKMDSKGPDAVV